MDLSGDPATERAYRMLEAPMAKIMREVGLTATFAGLCNHVAYMLHEMERAGKIDTDMAIEVIRAVAKTGQGSVSFATLNG